MQPFIYINGFPGVGKLTIARELQKLLPKAELIDNHQLIDPVAAIFERTDPEYQPARKELVSFLLPYAVHWLVPKLTLGLASEQIEAHCYFDVQS